MSASGPSEMSGRSHGRRAHAPTRAVVERLEARMVVEDEAQHVPSLRGALSGQPADLGERQELAV